MTDLATVTREVEDLHEFFVEWFGGSVAADDALFAERFSARFDAHSTMVPPNGTLQRIAVLGEFIRQAHGTSPDFRIQIRNVQIQRLWAGHALVTYEEWQRNAVNSEPPDNGRVSTVLLGTEGERLLWLHIHETWLPAEVMAAGPYDF